MRRNTSILLAKPIAIEGKEILTVDKGILRRTCRGWVKKTDWNQVKTTRAGKNEPVLAVSARRFRPQPLGQGPLQLVDPLPGDC